MAPNIGEGITPVKKILKVFFLLDKSYSMVDDGRISKLNDAIPVTIDALKNVQDDNPQLRIKVIVIAFSTNAEYYISDGTGSDLDSFNWYPLTPDGKTSTAQAIHLLCDQLDFEKMPKRAYPPVCVLVSDGYCTEPSSAYDAAIERLNNDPWGRKAARIVISIGNDLDELALRRFVNERGSYLNCTDSNQIVNYIRTVTTEATKTSSEGKANAPKITGNSLSLTPDNDNGNGVADQNAAF